MPHLVAEILIVPEEGMLDSAKAGAQYIARGLTAIGVKVREQISLCTDKRKLQQAVSVALGRSNIVVTIGGLDRETGFLTKTVMAQGLGFPLEVNEDCLDAIRAYCRRTGERFMAGDDELAALPQGCVPFPPSYGKVPGCMISSDTQHIVMLPESQQELAAMFNRYITPAFTDAEAATTVTHVIRTYGVREEYVREKLGDLTATANPAVTVQKDGVSEILVRVSAHASDSAGAAAVCTPVLRQVVSLLGDAAYGLDVDSLQTAVVTKMTKKELGLAVAEAGTGGMLTRVLGETPGGQDVLRYSIAAETPEVKAKKLGADAKLLKKRGNVSEYAAVAMANGAREHANAPIGVAIAANTNDPNDKKSEPGTVYIAVCDEANVYIKKLVIGDGGADADVITDAALSRAMNMVRLFVDYYPETYSGCIALDDALSGKKTITDKGSYDEAMPGEEDGDVETPSLLRRLGGNFIIRKADEPKEKVRKFIFILAVLIFLGCAGYLGYNKYSSYAAQKQAELYQNIFKFWDTTDLEVSPDFPSRYLESFGGLWTLNNDVVGFLSIDDTRVAYPVVQSSDNDYYLRRDFEENHNNYGIPFLDYRCDYQGPSDNLVVYGHNMKDGQIFGELLDYRSLDYYKEHPVIDFSTLYEMGQYKIFSIFITNAYEAQGPVFAYHDFIDAESSQDFANFVSQLQIRSLINTTVDVEPGDELLTLSTCTYEFQDARFVIVARKVRRGESAEVDTDNAKTNPQPLYPDIWYRLFGGTRPVGAESADIVTSTAVDTDAGALPNVENLAAGGGAALVSNTVVAASEEKVDSFLLDMAEMETRIVSEVALANADAKREAEEQAAQEELERQERERQEAILQAQREEEERKAREAAVLEAENTVVKALNEAKAAAETVQLAAAAAQEASASTQAAEKAKAAKEAASLVSQAASTAAAQAEKAGTDTAIQTAAQVQTLVATAQDYVTAANTAVSDLKAKEEAAAKKAAAAKAAAEKEYNYDDEEDDEGDYDGDCGTLTVLVNGKKTTGDALDIVSRIVQNEVGSSFHTEAIKAQAVATYTNIVFNNKAGTNPSVYINSSADSKVKKAVAEVLGQMVYYNGKVAFTPYFATSAGATCASKDVWGGSYPYLVSVDSSVDERVSGFKSTTTMTADKVEDLISSRLGIKVTGDPEDWFEVLTVTEGGYNGKMSVCGKTTSKSGSTITGRLVRETVLNLRSACFDIDYDSSTDKFTFTTYGYGHGVGLSQNGANLYAKDGWDYIEILEHYYPGTTVK